ncbi:MAG: lipopolysaccharide heptosyltransferase II [Magnetococcus sp. DMHC-6]
MVTLEKEGDILIVGPAWVGDMVMAQSLFIFLKQRAPHKAIDLLAPEWTRPLLERMPQVRQAISMPLRHGQLGVLTRFQLGRSLRNQGYKEAIVLPNSFKSALVPFWAHIPRRTGFVGEMRYGILNDFRQLDKKRLPRTVDRFLALALPSNAPLPDPMPRPCLTSDAQQVAKTVQHFALDPFIAPVMVLCPGAEYGPAKQWPAEHFSEIALIYIQRGWQVWMVGSIKELDITHKINHLTGGKCQNLAGKTTLDQAIDLLQTAQVVLCNDSGMMHVAAALERPLVALYGSSDPHHTPPLSPHAQTLSLGLPCAPCFKRHCPDKHTNCLWQLTPSMVLERLEKMNLT